MSIWNVYLDNVIRIFVTSHLQRFSDPTHGLVLTFHLSLSDYEKDLREYRTAQILFTRPNNYTKVMAGEGRDINKIEKWEMVADHDSCWVDGATRYLDNLYREMSLKIRGLTQDKTNRLGDHCFIDAVHTVHVDLERYEDPKYMMTKRYRPKKINIKNRLDGR